VQGGYIWDWKDKALYAKTPDGAEYLAYGGDYGDRPNSANDGCNGVFFADGSPKSHLFKVKRCYQMITFHLIDLKLGIFQAKNHFTFRDSQGYCVK